LFGIELEKIMKQTTLFKNESYLIVTSIISIGVLSGYEYFSLILSALLIIPVVRLSVKNVLNKKQLRITKLYKCASCK